VPIDECILFVSVLYIWSPKEKEVCIVGPAKLVFMSTSVRMAVGVGSPMVLL